MTAPAFRDDFDGPGVDGEVSVAHYLWGWTPLYGVIEVRAGMELSPPVDGGGLDGRVELLVDGRVVRRSRRRRTPRCR